MLEFQVAFVRERKTEQLYLIRMYVTVLLDASLENQLSVNVRKNYVLIQTRLSVDRQVRLHI